PASTPATLPLSLHDALPICASYDSTTLHPARIRRTHNNAPSPRREYYAKESESKAEPERAAVVHGCHLVSWEPRYERGRNGYNRDRKSTRLNSSHVKISYAV